MGICQQSRELTVAHDQLTRLNACVFFLLQSGFWEWQLIAFSMLDISVSYCCKIHAGVTKVRSDASLCSAVWRTFLLYMVCRTSESRPPHLGWAVIIQTGVNLSYSIYRTQCGHCSWSRATPSTSIQAKSKTHSSHRNNQAQKNSLTKKEQTQSIQNVSVKCLKEQVCLRAWAEQGPGHIVPLYLACVPVKLYSPLNPYEALKRQWNTI